MKRINMHLDEKMLEQLDVLLAVLRNPGVKKEGERPVFRADLIRLAIGKYFNINVPPFHVFSYDLVKEAKKIIRSSAWG